MSVLLWHIIPTLSSFSAMRTLHNVTPKVFMPALQRELKIAAKKKNTARLVHFVLKTIGYALVGFESFMIKFSLTAERQQKAESFLQAGRERASFESRSWGSFGSAPLGADESCFRFCALVCVRCCSFVTFGVAFAFHACAISCMRAHRLRPFWARFSSEAER